MATPTKMHPMSGNVRKMAGDIHEEELWNSPDTFLHNIEQMLWDVAGELDRLYANDTAQRLERVRELSKEIEGVVSGRIP